MAREYVVLVAGPMGAGKTTAIAALSEIPVVSTDASNTDLSRNGKATTTVAMDYGEIGLGEGDRMRLYGVPGQDRFDFMWRILEKRALGLLLLIDNSADDSLAELDRFLDVFRTVGERGAIVVGLTRNDLGSARPLVAYQARLRQEPDVVPVFQVDARDPGQMKTMLAALVALVEAKAVAANPRERSA